MSGRSSKRTAGWRMRRGPSQVEGTCALRIHRIGEDVPGVCLNQEGCVTDERDDAGPPVRRRGSPRTIVNAPRPPRSPLPQHPQDRGEWLRRRTAGIDESLAVKVISGRRSSHRARFERNSVSLGMTCVGASSISQCPAPLMTTPSTCSATRRPC